MITLHHRIQGSGPPLVMLHGLFGSLDNLGSIARLLESRFEVHSLDLRNHGRSPHCEQMDYHLMASDVLAHFDRFGLHQPDLLGHSMGGKTAMTLALDHPDRVRRLVVADIAPVTYPAHHESTLDAMLTLKPETLQSREEADALLKPAVPELPVRQFLLKNLIKRGENGYAWRLNLPVIARHYDRIREGQKSDHPWTGPTLFIGGGASNYLKPAYRDHTQRLFPNATLRILAGAHHWLHAEKPEPFSRLVENFLLDTLPDSMPA